MARKVWRKTTASEVLAQQAAGYTEVSGSHAPQTCGLCVVVDAGVSPPALLPTRLGLVRVGTVDPETFGSYLAAERSAPPAVALLGGRDPKGLLHALRGLREFDRTRAFLLADEELADAAWNDLDVEGAVPAPSIAADLAAVVERGLRAYEALGANPLLPKHYLDAKYETIFDWFEGTRWNWDEIDLSGTRPELLTDEELAVVKDVAVLEFGTLPGVHNFLREWSDEYSFSSWAVAWGAEEARHSLVLTRYLKLLGIETLAKHAMYKREPYPIGYNRAATLMMNVISESRASEYYRNLARITREPVLRRIWRFLSHDEGRHCRAFSVFCQELCDVEHANLVAALEMAYVFLADRQDGVKHPSGFFYPHSPSTEGIRRTEKYLSAQLGDPTSRADERVLAVIRKLTADPSVTSVAGIRAKLREIM